MTVSTLGCYLPQVLSYLLILESPILIPYLLPRFFLYPLVKTMEIFSHLFSRKIFVLVQRMEVLSCFLSHPQFLKTWDYHFLSCSKPLPLFFQGSCMFYFSLSLLVLHQRLRRANKLFIKPPS